jgi:hypothetical protein
MSDRRPVGARRPVLLAIDELFVCADGRAHEQEVWTALGALDVACPQAIAPLSAADLSLLVAVAREWEADAAASDERRGPVAGAARRLAHVLERAPESAAAGETARPARDPAKWRGPRFAQTAQQPAMTQTPVRSAAGDHR